MKLICKSLSILATLALSKPDTSVTRMSTDKLTPYHSDVLNIYLYIR